MSRKRFFENSGCLSSRLRPKNGQAAPIPKISLSLLELPMLMSVLYYTVLRKSKRGENKTLRKIVRTGEERCHGCGACAWVCYEGAIDPFGRQGVGCPLPSWNVSRPRTGAPPRSACNARGAGRGPTCAVALSASLRPRARRILTARRRELPPTVRRLHMPAHEQVLIGVPCPRRLSARAFFAKRGAKLLH